MLGANIGFYSVPLARRVKVLGGRLWAFEPARANYDLLRKNLHLNGVDDVATPVHRGLGDESAGLVMIVERASAGNAVIGRTDARPATGKSACA